MLCSVVLCNILYYYIALHCYKAYCKTCVVVQYCVAQCSAVFFSVAQCSIVQCSVVQYCVV